MIFKYGLAFQTCSRSASNWCTPWTRRWPRWSRRIRRQEEVSCFPDQIGSRQKNLREEIYALHLCSHTIKRYGAVFLRIWPAKFANGGSILGLSQFTQLTQLPLKTKLDLKKVKMNSKIIICLVNQSLWQTLYVVVFLNRCAMSFFQFCRENNEQKLKKLKIYKIYKNSSFLFSLFFFHNFEFIGAFS